MLFSVLLLGYDIPGAATAVHPGVLCAVQALPQQGPLIHQHFMIDGLCRGGKPQDIQPLQQAFQV